MRLRVEVCQGQDLLRLPSERCRAVPDDGSALALLKSLGGKKNDKGKQAAKQRRGSGSDNCTNNTSNTSNSGAVLSSASDSGGLSQCESDAESDTGSSIGESPIRGAQRESFVKRITSKIRRPQRSSSTSPVNTGEVDPSLSQSLAASGAMEELMDDDADVQRGLPFVHLRLQNSKENTSVANDARKWTWNEEFVFFMSGLWNHQMQQQQQHVSSPQMSPTGGADDDFELEIEVRDSIKCQSYGGIKIPLGRLSSSSKIKQWYQLTRPEWSPANDKIDDGSSNDNISNGQTSKLGSGVKHTSRFSTHTMQPSCAVDAVDESCGVLLLSLQFEEEDGDTSSNPTNESAKAAANKKKRRWASGVGLESSINAISPHGSPPAAVAARTAKRALPCRLVDYLVVAQSDALRGKETELVERFPKNNHDDLELPMKIECFIFPYDEPDKVAGRRVRRAANFAARGDDPNRRRINGNVVEFFTFVHAPRGVPLYGYCLYYQEQSIDSDSADDRFDLQNNDDDDTLALCIVSRVNSGDMFRECLMEIYREMTAAGDAAAQRRARQTMGHRLVNEVPMPLPGVLRVEFNLLPGAHKLFSSELTTPGDLPFLTFRDGISFLIEKLGLSLLIELWGTVLLEHKIVMHARDQYLLSLAGETLTAVLYPFRYHHTYVSVLPAELLDYVQAPLPFIYGIHSDLVSEISDFDLAEICLLDLNRGVLRKGVAMQVDPIPAAETRRLHRMLQHVIGINPCALDDPACDDNDAWENNFDSSEPVSMGPMLANDASEKRWCSQYLALSAHDSRRVQLCFLECICQLLQGYRECLFFLNDSMPVFNTPKFLEQRGQDPLFFSRFLETQNFMSFQGFQNNKWMGIFNAYFFRVRARDQSKEQYLALGSQKRLTKERRSAARLDPDEEDFDSKVRNRTPLRRQTLVKRVLCRNNNVWITRERRRAKEATEGLDIFEVDEVLDENLNEENSGQHSTVKKLAVLTCLAEQPEEKGQKDMQDEGNPLSLANVHDKCGVELLRLRAGLCDLRNAIGTHHWDEMGFRLSDSSSSEYSCTDEEEGGKAVAGDKNMLNESVFPPIRVSPREPKGSRREFAVSSQRASSITMSIAPFDADVSYLGSAKTMHDRRVELTLQECVTLIFLNKEVGADQQQVCADNFHASKHARDLFVLIIYQPHHRSVFTAQNSSTRGRGLRQGAFESLVFLCIALLDACVKKDDFSNVRQMLELSQSYYLDRSAPAPIPPSPRSSPHSGSLFGTSEISHTPNSAGSSSGRGGNASSSRKFDQYNRRRSFAADQRSIAPVRVAPEDYLEYYVRNLPIWNSLLFWEDAFAEVLGAETRKHVRGSLGVLGRTQNNTVSTRKPCAIIENELGSLPAKSNRINGRNSPATARRMTAPPGAISPTIAAKRGENSDSSTFACNHNQVSESSEIDGDEKGVETDAVAVSAIASEHAQNDVGNKGAQDLLFELATSMVHQMLRLGASEDKARALIARIVTQHGLNEEHEDTLCTLVSNVSMAVHAN